MSGSRDRILSRIRIALADRDVVEHPGAFLGWRPADESASAGDGSSRGPTIERNGADPVDGFVTLFHAAGGETVLVEDLGAARSWLVAFAKDYPTIAFGRGVPDSMRPDVGEGRPGEPPPALCRADPREARLGVSMARGAVAETGSLIMDARDGRRAQLLVPTHVVIVEAATVHATLVGALTDLKSDLPSAIGLHSGPSKSADIGQIMVKGVHGPGRLIALVVGKEIDR